jgi:hypothetical protein
MVVSCGLIDGERLRSVEFTSTGCASETKSGLYDADSKLILDYTSDGVLVTRKNAEMNCAIKIDGIGCDVSVIDHIIKYKVYQKSEMYANCSCLVEEMASTVTGLDFGENYTLYYWCEGELPLVAIDFTYTTGLKMVLDPELYYAPLVDMGDGTWRADVPVWWE